MNAPRSGCSISLTLEALGDRWSLIVIRDLMLGNCRHLRESLTRSEERIASNVLADRLTRLENAGLVSRRDDASHKQKVIYSLTEASIAVVGGGRGDSSRVTPPSLSLSAERKGRVADRNPSRLAPVPSETVGVCCPAAPVDAVRGAEGRRQYGGGDRGDESL